MLRQRRVELFLLAAFLLPVLFPGGIGLDGVLGSGIAALLPAVPDRSKPGGDDAGYREAYYRLLLENAELRARLVSQAEPKAMVAMEEAYWDRRPLRIEAPVLGKDDSPWRGSLLVGAGTREGVAPGMPVVSGGVMVGTVVSAGPLASRVLLLTDPAERLWALVLSGEAAAEGALVGTGGETLSLRYLAAGVGKVGDPVFTAGGSPLVPRGLLLGRISEIGDRDRDGVSEVEVEPALAAGDIRVVNILAVER